MSLGPTCPACDSQTSLPYPGTGAGASCLSFPAQCPNSGPNSMGLPCPPCPLVHTAETQSDVRNHAAPLPPIAPAPLSTGPHWDQNAFKVLHHGNLQPCGVPQGQLGLPWAQGTALAETPPLPSLENVPSPRTLTPTFGKPSLYSGTYRDPFFHRSLNIWGPRSSVSLFLPCCWGCV